MNKAAAPPGLDWLPRARVKLARYSLGGAADWSKAHENRLRLQPDTPGLLHVLLDLVLERDYFCCCSPSAIDDGQRMLAGYANVAIREALGKSGVLHQPSCGNFSLRILGRIAGNLQILFSSSQLELVVLLCPEHGVLEERSGAATVRVTGSNQHGLAGANLANGFPCFRKSRLLLPVGKLFLQIAVRDVRFTFWR